MPAGRGGRLARVFGILPSALLAFSTAATAASVFDGSYGDKDGCRYAKTGESSGSDSFFLLTDTGITTSTAVCSFVSSPQKKGSGFVGKIACESEDGPGEPQAFELLKGAKGYTVAFDDGTRWGPLPKCR